MKFSEKNVVILGGSTGIGLATAEAFINAGENVWITGRSEKNLQPAALKIGNPKLKTLIADTSSLAGIADLEKAISENGINIHVLHLNSGIGIFSPIEHTTEADFDAQFNTNVKAHYFTLQKLIPHLAEGSSVVFTSSGAATAARLNSGVYSATKSALNKIAQIAANELAGRKIRVNIVSPVSVATEAVSLFPDEIVADLASITALQRMGEPEEIAKVVLFLASDDASFITGI
ncbi:NAD(P)-dependent dehydrogenase, short-chain alcohol dehydrogenase family [Pedobacter westerhofensis]|uniref:NAD(P)-dependent dehydrogenase, short-chain alcohol dehydrogenase family n=1 Tax=Pedobacter westerhofensis TaxID=425512 RepID=A0A521AU42_9SPHI|nr:SDR family oxidoreductase [Pedobacter westerhofensis]SMO38251.1 NAD(P)-dependent dehydrogenase, short-chain alcohol dehydrogenase family [Pedobacter westerhofensis]